MSTLCAKKCHPARRNRQNSVKKTMNIFEDLIDELKEENLLEETVIETSRAKENAAAKNDNIAKIETAPETQTADVPPVELPEESEIIQTPLTGEAEFYRRRAMDEVAFLQIVEHVFAGVEREQLKIVPKPYADLEVKKVLHNFVQLSPDADSSERSKAEFQLMQETESWHSSLSLRDERLTTAHLRRYCETSRPPLSSPALVALARFYRNSPYSEPVRNKFDLVVTRLFSKENGKSQREMVFSRDELVKHLAELYAEWSSVPLYATEADDAEILKIAGKFESYTREADDAIGFDDLIKSDFFTRLHSFKRSTNENFYAPLITAVGIESNIRIGNRYVELLETEKKKGNVAALEDRYGFTHDSTISEATGKTFSLIELLKQRKPVPPPVKVKIEQREPEAAAEKVKPPKKEASKETAEKSKSNKWLIVAAAIIVLIIAGIYLGTKSARVETKEPASKPRMNLENSMLKEYLLEARLEDGTLVGIVSPTWNHLTEEKRKDALKQMLSFGGEKGYKKVQLENKAGKTIGTAEGASILVLE